MWPDCSSPKQVAGAADVEVVRGEREAGAERVQRLQYLQTLLGAFAERLADGDGEIGVGARFDATDAAAQLIELREAEHFGAVHDQRVGVG